MKTLTRLSAYFLFTLGLMATGNIVLAQGTLNAAQYTDDAELMYPPNLDEWIHMGTSLGGDYGEEEFDPAHPGTLGVVQMEPSAYRYYLKNGEYADGTMLLLSFYQSEVKSNPQLQGFVQGERRLQEIHVIDKRRFTEERGFFVFPNPSLTAAEKIADGSDCVQCHMEHGGFDGTFIQFYPTIRDLP